jgi:hypothetical protein
VCVCVCMGGGLEGHTGRRHKSAWNNLEGVAAHIRQARVRVFAGKYGWWWQNGMAQRKQCDWLRTRRDVRRPFRPQINQRVSHPAPIMQYSCVSVTVVSVLQSSPAEHVPLASAPAECETVANKGQDSLVHHSGRAYTFPGYTTQRRAAG